MFSYIYNIYSASYNKYVYSISYDKWILIYYIFIYLLQKVEKLYLIKISK